MALVLLEPISVQAIPSTRTTGACMPALGHDDSDLLDDAGLAVRERQTLRVDDSALLLVVGERR